MLPGMKYALLLALAFAHGIAFAAPRGEWNLTAEEWLRPRDGDRVLGFEALSAAVQTWDAHPGALIVIHYPGGDEGLLWAAQLRDWLVALGVPSAAIQTALGNERTDALSIAVDGGVEPSR